VSGGCSSRGAGLRRSRLRSCRRCGGSSRAPRARRRLRSQQLQRIDQFNGYGLPHIRCPCRRRRGGHACRRFPDPGRRLHRSQQLLRIHQLAGCIGRSIRRGRARRALQRLFHRQFGQGFKVGARRSVHHFEPRSSVGSHGTSRAQARRSGQERSFTSAPGHTQDLSAQHAQPILQRRRRPTLRDGSQIARSAAGS
jgi:hypothetical protein